jgi:PKD repeat protein
MGPTYANLYRDDNVTGYPYILPGVVNIYRSNSTTPTGYYYYFYNWVVDMPDCISARIPVTAFVNPSGNASFTYVANNLDVDFTSTSNPADFWDWDFGDGGTSALENPSHTYSAPGTYTVTLIAGNSCGSDTAKQVVTVVNVGMDDLSAAQIVIFPNPANEYVSVMTGTRRPVRAELTDATGRIIYMSDVCYSVQISLATYRSGMYFLKLNDGHNVVFKKIIKE